MLLRPTRFPFLTLSLVAVLFLAASAGAATTNHDPGGYTYEQFNLPNLGHPSDVNMSPAEQAKLGAEVVSELYRHDYIVQDPEIEDFLNQIGWRLAAVGSQHPPHFHFYLIADNEINAFALPGASIGVNDGLIVATRSENELAAVMAHEEAHVTQRHIARMAGDSTVGDIATWVGMIAAMIASGGNPNVILGALSAGQAINYQRQISYTRGHEMEADRVGIRTLAAAGFDPRAMAEFFQRLEEQSRLYGNQIPDILLSHPVDSVRIAEAQERAAQYPKRKISSSTQYYLMRARARVLGFDLPSQAVNYYASELKSGHETAENQYGYAMALSTAAKYADALKALAPLYAKLPNQPNVELLEARLQLANGQTQPALALFGQVLHRYPSYAPAILASAKALIRAGHPRRARDVLLSHEQSFGAQVKTYKLLARAARQLGDVAEAQYQEARYLEAQGDLRGALEQVNAGLRLSSISADGRARLHAERASLMQRIPKAELREVNRQQDGS